MEGTIVGSGDGSIILQMAWGVGFLNQFPPFHYFAVFFQNDQNAGYLWNDTSYLADVAAA